MGKSQLQSPPNFLRVILERLYFAQTDCLMKVQNFFAPCVLTLMEDSPFKAFLLRRLPLKALSFSSDSRPTTYSN